MNTETIKQLEQLGDLHDRSVKRQQELIRKNMVTMDLISRFAEKQKHGWHCCPRCGMDRMNKDAARNALSRRVDIMICDLCGNIEGIEDIPGNPKLPLEKWALIEHPERFFLKGQGKDYFNNYFTFSSWEGYPFKNAYVIVEAFCVDDAFHRFRLQWPDKNPGTYNFTFSYTEETWRNSEDSRRLPCAGVLRLNDVFEEAE